MFDAANVFDVILKYFGNGFLLFLTMISIIYIFATLNKRRKISFLIVLSCLVLFLLNDLVYLFFKKMNNNYTYYRVLWVIPVFLICSYALTHFIFNCKLKRHVRALVVVGVALAAVSLNSTYLSNISRHIIHNKYLMQDEIMYISELMHSDTDQDNPRLALCSEFELTYISYDANAEMVIGRDYYLNESGNHPENSSNDSVKQKYLLAELTTYGTVSDISGVLDALENEDVEYIAVPKQAEAESYMSSLNCTFIGDAVNFRLYRFDGVA